jgi:hypothetical protein
MTYTMKNTAFISAFAAASMMMTSCAMYVPTSHTLVTPDKKGDVALTGSFGNRGLEGNVVYAVSDKVAITGDVRSKSSIGPFSTTHNITTAGAGLALYGSRDKIKWSILGGFNVGGSNYESESITDDSHEFYTNSKHNRMYIQPMLSYRSGDFETIGSLQLSNTSVNVTSNNRSTIDDILSYNMTAVEPMLTLRVHAKRVIPFVQVGATLTNNPMYHANATSTANYFNAAAGVTIPLEYNK